LLLVVVLTSGLAAARENEAWTLREDSAAYRSECSACHIAFPPGLLTTDDWLAIMSDLDHHFGANAALDGALRAKIGAFLGRNAATSRQFASQDDTPRITTAPWFLRKHQSALRLLFKGRVKSLAECAACHKGPEIDTMSGQ
jgi:hypothetical protein